MQNAGVPVSKADQDLKRVAANLAKEYPHANKQEHSARVEAELTTLLGNTRTLLSARGRLAITGVAGQDCPHFRYSSLRVRNINLLSRSIWMTSGSVVFRARRLLRRASRVATGEPLTL
jgi:hypothetical protein